MSSKARGIQNVAKNIPEHRDLAEDIMNAKSNMTMLISLAEQMGSNEMNTLMFLNQYAQHEMFILYKTLLKFKINEDTIMNLTSLTDTQILEVSNIITKINLDPRIVIASAGLAWYDLDTEILNPLNDRMISIQNAVVKISYDVITLEYLLKALAKVVKIAVDDLTAGLVNEEQLTEVTFLLDNMNGMINSQIEILRFTREQLVTGTESAVKALEDVIYQQKI